MCDEGDMAEAMRQGLTRRRFGAIGLAGGAMGAAACAPVAGGTSVIASETLRETTVSFATADGTMDGFFVQPAEGRHPAVLLWPDIAGVREAKRQMARRLAGAGYSVLVANPYYRDVAGEQFADFPAFAAAGGFQMVTPWRGKLDAGAIMRDAAAAIGWLDQQDGVDTARGVGTQGYCMGGPFTVWTAAAVPGRVRGAASFHGGGLVRSDDPLSPHKLLTRSRASHLFAVAQDDDAKAPGDKDALRAAADLAKRQAEIEVYPANHGWCVPDSPKYDEVQAERAWARLLALYAGM